MEQLTGLAGEVGRWLSPPKGGLLKKLALFNGRVKKAIRNKKTCSERNQNYKNVNSRKLCFKP